jgi:hypothetical protein
MDLAALAQEWTHTLWLWIGGRGSGVIPLLRRGSVRYNADGVVGPWQRKADPSAWQFPEIQDWSVGTQLPEIDPDAWAGHVL